MSKGKRKKHTQKRRRRTDTLPEKLYSIIKAARVAAYARRAEKKMPLFQPPLTAEELRPWVS